MPSPRRLIAIMSGCALLAGVGGFVAASFVLSPAESAARTTPPAAGPISVPVTRTVLQSKVVTRGDVNFSDPVQITIPAGSGTQVLTGRVPDAGAEVTEGIVLAEVSGRPVIALGGALPSYRTLVPGSTGPDVRQLQEALTRLGYSPGEVDGGYDGEVAAAVAALYAAVGYAAPSPSAEASAALDAAKQRESTAAKQVGDAQAALTAAGKGPTRSAKLAANAAVNAADAALAQAKAQNPANPAAVQAAQDQLDIAKAQRAETLADPDTSQQESALESAQSELDAAQKALTEAEAAVATPLPNSEAVYLTSLPRRVDEVLIDTGAVLNGPLMQVSGAALQVKVTVSEDEAALLTVGMTAQLTIPGTGAVAATISSVATAPPTADAADATRREVVLAPAQLATEQATALRGANIKVIIDVASTQGEVLAVPLAALFSDADANTQVEVLAADGSTRFQRVTTGLTAGGQVEVHPVDAAGTPVAESAGTLDQTSLVVVGR
jgi:multidrug efflux pump subunit AcrA (membrane-fusion protein)